MRSSIGFVYSVFENFYVKIILCTGCLNKKYTKLIMRNLKLIASINDM